ncbi:MAG: baseplate J/gp47 family protein [Thermodesulfobacteriota bacterium]|nr:baseplate J/gp47 family protein [Thermodesulfobacteriota bacterium]
MSIPVEKTLDEIRQEMFDRINAVQDEYAAKGWLPIRLNLNKGVIRGMIELWSWGLYQLYQFLAFVLTQASAATATGAWLDWHCSQVGITRREATKAAGTVYFTRLGSSGNVSIPAGRIVRTKPDGTGAIYRFVTTEDVVLLDGGTEVAAPVEAENYGTAGNVVAGQICEVSTTISGVDGVENRSDWLSSEGVDKEDDEALRQRHSLQWQANNGVTKYAYMAWAMSVAGVVSVTILDQHPRGQGTVDVVIKGSAGVPTPALIDAVDVAIGGQEPINDDYLVKGPTPVDITIEAELELVSGNAADILAEAENRLTALFTEGSNVTGITPLAIGQDVTMDLLVSTVMAVAGVKKTNWTLPVDDTQIDVDEMAVLAGITLTAVAATEV